MDLKNKTILFLGDSITEGHGTTSEEKRFTNIVSKTFGANFINDGIGEVEEYMNKMLTLAVGDTIDRNKVLTLFDRFF